MIMYAAGRLVQYAKRPLITGGRLREMVRLRSAIDCCTGNGADVAADDTKVVQLAIAHAAQFVDRLTIFAPIAQGAGYVDDDPLSGGSVDVSGPYWPCVV